MTQYSQPHHKGKFSNINKTCSVNSRCPELICAEEKQRQLGTSLFHFESYYDSFNDITDYLFEFYVSLFLL